MTEKMTEMHLTDMILDELILIMDNCGQPRALREAAGAIGALNGFIREATGDKELALRILTAAVRRTQISH